MKRKGTLELLYGNKPPTSAFIQPLVVAAEHVQSFLDQRCEVGPDKKEPAKNIYRDYEHWSTHSAPLRLRKSQFYADLYTRGFVRKRVSVKGKTWLCWLGFSLI